MKDAVGVAIKQSRTQLVSEFLEAGTFVQHARHPTADKHVKQVGGACRLPPVQ